MLTCRKRESAIDRLRFAGGSHLPPGVVLVHRPQARILLAVGVLNAVITHSGINISSSVKFYGRITAECRIIARKTVFELLHTDDRYRPFLGFCSS